MDENKTPEEPTPTPPAPTPAPAPTPSYQSQAAAAVGGSLSGGPVPFSGPANPSIASEDRTQALLAWVLIFVVSILSPIIFFFVGKDKPFVKAHAAQALTLMLSFIAAYIVVLILSVVAAFAHIPLGLILIPLLMLAGLGMLAIIIMGAIAANAGSEFMPPLTGKLCKSIFKV